MNKYNCSTCYLCNKVICERMRPQLCNSYEHVYVGTSRSCVCVCVCVYSYSHLHSHTSCIHTHTHTHTHTHDSGVSLTCGRSLERTHAHPHTYTHHHNTTTPQTHLTMIASLSLHRVTAASACSKKEREERASGPRPRALWTNTPPSGE